MTNPPKSQSPAVRKVTPLERMPASVVLPPERTRHIKVNIDVTVHRVIYALGFLILVVAAVLS